MKKLLECKKGEKVKVIKLNADCEIKQRLISFGIMKDIIIQILEHTIGKKTVEVKVGKMRVALRAKEAEMIEVEKI